MRVIFICWLHNAVALSMLDEFAFVRRKKVVILIFYFHVLKIFSAKCCNFGIQLCNIMYANNLQFSKRYLLEIYCKTKNKRNLLFR